MKMRHPTPAEIALWKAATTDVRRAKPVPEDAVADEPSIVTPQPPVAPKRIMPPPTALPAMRHAFDPNLERRIFKRQARVEARLDLHGMTQTAAYAALKEFIGQNAAEKRRLLLVVTGKGPMGQGVLKQNLPRWLESPPLTSVVSAVRPAFDHHGGDGALYVLLRKHRASILNHTGILSR